MQLPQVNYVVNDKGKKVFVQLPAKEWELLVKEVQRLQTLLRFKEELKSAFREVREIQQGKRKAVTLQEFLNEVKNNPD
jgi:hypothetical protein